jgi:hypothetical protein
MMKLNIKNINNLERRPILIAEGYYPRILTVNVSEKEYGFVIKEIDKTRIVILERKSVLIGTYGQGMYMLTDSSNGRTRLIDQAELSNIDRFRIELFDFMYSKI